MAWLSIGRRRREHLGDQCPHGLGRTTEGGRRGFGRSPTPAGRASIAADDPRERGHRGALSRAQMGATHAGHVPICAAGRCAARLSTATGVARRRAWARTVGGAGSFGAIHTETGRRVWTGSQVARQTDHRLDARQHGRGPEMVRQRGHPSRRTRLVGRERELTRLLSVMRERQVITLTGIGGIGKSRLAMEASLRAETAYSEGSRWIELSSLTDSSDVPGAIAGALGVLVTSTEATVETIAEWLAGRRELLVLDNCEHVLAAVAGLVDVITARCPGVTVLATSRIPLGLPGEVAWVVKPLSPESAFALFEERTFEIDADLTLGEHDRDNVRRICERVDGHPLAIEIAAAQVRSRSIEDILDVLPREFGGGRPRSRSNPAPIPRRLHYVVSSTPRRRLETTISGSFGLPFRIRSDRSLNRVR